MAARVSGGRSKKPAALSKSAAYCSARARGSSSPKWPLPQSCRSCSAVRIGGGPAGGTNSSSPREAMVCPVQPLQCWAERGGLTAGSRLRLVGPCTGTSPSLTSDAPLFVHLAGQGLKGTRVPRPTPQQYSVLRTYSSDSSAIVYCKETQTTISSSSSRWAVDKQTPPVASFGVRRPR